MDEREQLTQARNQLKESVSTAWGDLKNYGRAVVNNTGAKIENFKENSRIRAEERAREAEIRERTREHKSGMKEAFKAQEREQRRERIIGFKEGIKQKTSAVFGKLGTIKNTVVEKLRPSNLDVKFRNFAEKTQIAGLTAISKGKEFVIDTKDKVVDFGAQQMANYYLRQEERQEAKAFKEATILGEQQEIKLQKARIKERKAAMKEALNAQEREMYEQKHIENQARKEELMTSIFGEKEEPEIGHYARAR